MYLRNSFLYFIYLKDCGTILKEARPAAAQETLPIVVAKLERTAQCGTAPVPQFFWGKTINEHKRLMNTCFMIVHKSYATQGFFYCQYIHYCLGALS